VTTEVLARWLVDGTLAALLTVLAAMALFTSDPRRAVVVYMAFGLLLALAWARLLAPDLALAEAGIGAGVTGALLLRATRGRPEGAVARARPVPPAPAPRWLLAFGCLALFAALTWAYLSAYRQPGGPRLAELVLAHLDSTGVSNPVTAVLLNYRLYDTLLELAVILVAAFGVRALGPAGPGHPPAPPLLNGFVRGLVPLLVLTAGYLLWAGAHAPGGAFQAGALLGAAGVILHLAGHPRAGLPGEPALRIALVAGVAAFLAVGLAVTGLGLRFLELPRAAAGTLILVMESAAVLAIGAALVSAYLGGHPRAARADAH
jgi:multisubunit Na+/H+ antiporter MnhB subunit